MLDKSALDVEDEAGVFGLFQRFEPSLQQEPGCRYAELFRQIGKQYRSAKPVQRQTPAAQPKPETDIERETVPADDGTPAASQEGCVLS